MRAVEIREPGGPEALVSAEVPEPAATGREVVIEVIAAGINRADAMQRRGRYQPPKGASPLPGLEVSGHVVACGPEVVDATVGDAVCALLPGGGYAERVAVDERLLLPIPAGVDPVDAAGLPEVAATVWSNVFTTARLTADELLLVHGGSGGIGTCAIQLATARGATVITTARAANAAALTELGAVLVIDYREQDFAVEIDRFTEGGGVDVILDHLGASYLERNISALATDGRIATIGLQGGATTALNLAALMGKRGSLSATTLRSRPLWQRAEIIAAVRRQVWPLVESGEVRPVIAHRLPLAEAAQAHRLLDEGGYLGKLLLTV